MLLRTQAMDPLVGQPSPRETAISAYYHRNPLRIRAHVHCLGLIAIAGSCGSPETPSARVDAHVEVAGVRERPPTVVFEARRDGYHAYRIPALVALPGGTLLAFAEGRVDSFADNGDIDLLLRRSADGGRTWGPLQEIADNGGGVAGNPSPVVDRRSGELILFSTRNPVDDRMERSVWVHRSSDAGATWSAGTDVTARVSREGWRWYATGPGHGIQLSEGPHRGRLVVAAAHTVEVSSERRRGFHLLLSDDGGRSWRIGASAEESGWIEPSEAAIAELPGGRIVVNVRDQGGASPATRAVARSDDGGMTFSERLRSEDQLRAPVVHASLIGLASGHLVFIAPAHPSRRRRLQIRVSSGAGDGWRDDRVIWARAAGYSDVALVSPRTLGVLFESGMEDTREAIRFTRVPIDFDPRPPAIAVTRSRAHSTARP